MRSKDKKSFWGILGTILLLSLGKLKYLVVLLKVFKLQTLISMFIYLGTYALMYGWKFAVALVYLLFVHEMGHSYAARKIKLPTSPAIFIPFVGAVIGLKEMPKNAKDEGYVAYMGPLFGLLSYLPAIPLYIYTQEPFWALVIILGGLLNLFNLIPMTPLDGGRIVAGVSTRLWGIGLVLLFLFSLLNLSVIGFLVVIIGSIQWYSIYKRQKNLGIEKQQVEEYLDTNNKLIERSAISDEHFVFYANSIKSSIKNEELKATFQILDKTYTVSSEETGEDEEKNSAKEIISEFLSRFNEQVLKLKADYEHASAYYQTDKKTKIQLFLIYLGLVAVLGTSVYFANDILMNSPEVQEMMSNR